MGIKGEKFGLLVPSGVTAAHCFGVCFNLFMLDALPDATLILLFWAQDV